METRMELVTPAKAEAWLDANRTNRKLREGIAEKYAEDMRHGRWTQCTAPIAFYKDGDLADGQHRLFAVIESGQPQEFVVMRGLSREDGLNIDTGLNRSLVDAGKISGLDTGLSNELIAYSRGVVEGHQGASRKKDETGTKASKGLSNADKLQMVAAHREAVTWVIHNGPKGRNLRNGPIMCALARAWYWEADKDRLKRFAEVFQTGFADHQDESAAIALRNYFMTKPNLTATATWRDTFLKAQNAISYFMKHKKLTVIRHTEDEPYPLKKLRRVTK